MESTKEKLQRMERDLAGMPRVLVCYSGGVDSAFLLRVAADVLGPRAIALTAISPSIPPEEVAAARALAAGMDVRRVEVDSQELLDPRYAANPSNRCFYCKSELFTRAAEVALSLAQDGGGPFTLLDGTNLDDLSDHRPGRDAARAAGVRSPLADARLTKDEIRALSRERGLPTWDKPSAPCLASRIPYGFEVTEERLAQVASAERAVRSLGFRGFRVRWHESVARLEVAPSDFPRLLDADVRRAVIAGVKAAGFAFVALDLEGFRSGALNVLAADVAPVKPGSPA